MNKTININLGGHPFIIDEKAYDLLSTYLNRLESHFSYSEGCEEIIEDIEMRIAELFNERLKTRQIVTTADFDYIVEVMGKPEDLGCSTESDEHSTYAENGTAESGRNAYEFKVGKKIFRDEENKLVGGVCSGISTYIGLEDPIWVRVLFAVFFFGLGFGGVAYLVLWMAIPAAKTRQDRMAMRGKKIDINSIAKTIENEFNNLSESLSDMGDVYKQKRKEKTKHKRHTTI